MARNSVLGVGAAGLVFDIKPQLLPPNLWSDGRNVRFDKQKVFAMGGVEPVFAETKPGIMSVALVASTTTRYTMYSRAGKIYSFDGATETEITQTGLTYAESGDDIIQYEMYNGYMILNNGMFVPQVWVPGEPSGLVDLPNWDVLNAAQVIRPYGAFLFALNIIKGIELYPHMVKWSSASEAGALPTWDHTDPTTEAGEFSLPDTKNGIIVDGRQLGDRFFVYKQGAIHSFGYVGGQDVFARTEISTNIGLSIGRSLVTVPHRTSEKHFFYSEDGFYLMDGLRVIPIFEEVFKRELKELADPEHLNRSFSVVNLNNSEVWFCFPERGANSCTLAFTWNYLNETYSLRELSGTHSIASGVGLRLDEQVSTADVLFDDGTSFSDGVGFYDEILTEGGIVIVEASAEREQLYYLETGYLNYEGEPFDVWVERQALSAIGPKPGEEADYRVRKLIHAVVPKLYGGSVTLEVGVQEAENQAVSWAWQYTISPNDYIFKFPEPVACRFVSFRFRRSGIDEFSMAGFDYEVSLLGEF